MNLEKILVPLDGSGFGEQALPVAMSIARRTEGALVLAHVQASLPFAPKDVITKPLEEAATRYLAEVERKVREHEPAIPFSIELLHGPVEDALDDHIRTSGADLVVMATHGRGPISRFWLGSVADGLVRRVYRPILLVRPAEEGERPPTDGFRHILIPLDGSAAAEQILEPAMALGAAYEARYTLLRVAALTVPLPLIEDPGSVVPMLEMQERERAAKYLADVAGRLKQRGVDVHTAIPSAVHPAEGILSYAVRNLVDLIAVTTRGTGGVNRARIGSVADKIVRGAEAPVLVLKPEAEVG